MQVSSTPPSLKINGPLERTIRQWPQPHPAYTVCVVGSNKSTVSKTMFHIWEGIYKDFETAQSNSVGGGFTSQRYIDQSERAIGESLEYLKQNGSIDLFHKQRFTLLPTVTSLISKFIIPDKRIKIIDFGGGFGMGHLTCLEETLLKEEDLDYTIIELPEVCSAGSVFAKRHGLPIKFSSAISDDSEADLIFCSSAFQYINNWKGLIRQFADVAPKAILMSDVFCGSFGTFATLQNYYESKVPHWFFNVSEFINEFFINGYTMISKSVATGVRAGNVDLLPMDNFPESNRLETSSHLLFWKNTQV